MSSTKVAIVGANGRLGPSILNALTSNPAFSVTVLSRASSKSKYSSDINVALLPDELPHTSLVSALKGHKALVIAISGNQTDNSLQFIRAAAEAGVSRIIPADFGSCDSADPRSLALIPLYGEKVKVRNHLTQLAKDSDGAVSWTSIVCGHFLDFGLTSGLMAIDIKGRKAWVYDGGDKHFSASVLRTIGAAVVGVLSNLEATRDQVVYVQSVSTTQNELLKTVEKVVGGQKFEVVPRDSEEYIREMKAELKRKPGDHDATEELVSVEGIVNGDWTARETFMNQALGLPDEDLEALVRDAIKE